MCIAHVCIFVKLSTCQLFFVVFGKLIYAIAMSNTLFRQKVWADGFFPSFLRQNGELFVGTIRTPGGIEMSLCNTRPLMDHCNADSQKPLTLAKVFASETVQLLRSSFLSKEAASAKRR